MLPWAFVLHTCLAAEAVYLRLRPGVPAEDALNAARDQKAFRDVADLDDEILAFAERMRARFAVFYPTLSYMPPEAFAHLILPWLVRKRYVADCKPGLPAAYTPAGGRASPASLACYHSTQCRSR